MAKAEQEEEGAGGPEAGSFSWNVLWGEAQTALEGGDGVTSVPGRPPARLSGDTHHMPGSAGEIVGEGGGLGSEAPAWEATMGAGHSQAGGAGLQSSKGVTETRRRAETDTERGRRRKRPRETERVREIRTESGRERQADGDSDTGRKRGSEKGGIGERRGCRPPAPGPGPSPAQGPASCPGFLGNPLLLLDSVC